MTSKMGEIFPAFLRYSTGFSAIFHRPLADQALPFRRYVGAFPAICRPVDYKRVAWQR